MSETNLTFTLSRLKQQNRQFSSNDQSDTAVGLRSIDTKQMINEKQIYKYTIKVSHKQSKFFHQERKSF